MKRITKLEISNFRAFFDSYTIELDKGENLLIYGENGSGKSSLFKSVSNFLSSSQDTTFPYVRHLHKSTEEGNLTFTFNEYDLTTNKVTSVFGSVVNFGTDSISTDTEQFLKTAELTKGFLDYRILLAVYNHSEAQPNLFQLIVEVLLKDFIPVGYTYPLGKRFIGLVSEIWRCRTRRTLKYRNTVAEMVLYEKFLRVTLNDIFEELNKLLLAYFDLNLTISYLLTPLIATGHNWRKIPTELKLEIKLNGRLVPHQSDFLNEARLSALAICLYLAIMKRNAQSIDYKVLFLDDVFIGLDLSNRLPILDIIKNEFTEYQVFISTYDRHLYELAKRKFKTEVPGRWKSVELYVGKDSINGNAVDRPILVVGQTDFEKGSHHLHHREKPDYPAAANYFRKALEKVIPEYIPKWETADDENTQIPDYSLSVLAVRAKRFLDKSGNPSSTLNQIITLLKALLHPLSHYEFTSPVYRGELLRIERLIPSLISELKLLDIPNQYKVKSKRHNTVKIKFTIDKVTGHFSIYELKTSEPFTLKFNPTGTPTILPVSCCISKCHGENSGAKIHGTSKAFSNEEKALPQNNFSSIQDAYDRLYETIVKIPAIGPFAKSADYLDDIEYLNERGEYTPIKDLLVWETA